jgi:hypothetical protein
MICAEEGKAQLRYKIAPPSLIHGAKRVLWITVVSEGRDFDYLWNQLKAFYRQRMRDIADRAE